MSDTGKRAIEKMDIIDKRVTAMETRAEEYVKKSDISATLARIETALDYHKWVLGLLVLGQIFALGRLFQIF